MIEPFGNWLEHLMIVSLGRAVPGIKPSIGNLSDLTERPGKDYFIVNFLMNGDVKQKLSTDMLDRSGCPYLTYRLNDIYDLGALFFTWEMACAVAAYILKIQPFDSPNDVISSATQPDPSSKEIASVA
jgi:glucose-6-phosphate isomerase